MEIFEEVAFFAALGESDLAVCLHGCSEQKGQARLDLCSKVSEASRSLHSSRLSRCHANKSLFVCFIHIHEHPYIFGN